MRVKRRAKRARPKPIHIYKLTFKAYDGSSVSAWVRPVKQLSIPWLTPGAMWRLWHELDSRGMDSMNYVITKKEDEISLVKAYIVCEGNKAERSASTGAQSARMRIET